MEIGYDALDDGMVDRRLGYDYAADGHLTRSFIWQRGRTFTAIEYLPDGRPRAWCHGSDCRAIAYDDASRSALAATYDAKLAVKIDSELDVTYDDQWRVATLHSCWYYDTDIFESQVELAAQDGVLRNYDRQDPDDIMHAEYDAHGQLSYYDEQNDPGTYRARCGDDGWETQHDECEDSQCDINHSLPGLAFAVAYVRDIDGRIISSKTTLTLPSAASFSTAYNWSPDGRAVELVSGDDKNLWTDTSTIYLDPPPSQRETDSDGNVIAVRSDLDRNGSFESVDLYTYSGQGACRQGTNPQLAPETIMVTSELPYSELAYSCRFSPVSKAIQDKL